MVRQATPADAPAIARVQVDTWRTAYRGIVADDFLAALSYEERARMWSRALSDAEGGSHTYVGQDADGQVVAFISRGRGQSDDPEHEAELYAIYVLEEHQGEGLGRLLVRRLVEGLERAGMRSMLLWVFAENHSARRFYERIGGQYVRTQEFELGGVTMQEVAYGWNDLRALLQQLDHA